MAVSFIFSVDFLPAQSLVPDDGEEAEAVEVGRLILLGSGDRRQSVDFLNTLPGIRSISRPATVQSAMRLGQAGNPAGRGINTAGLINRIYIAELEDGVEATLLARMAERHPSILIAEPDYALHLSDEPDAEVRPGVIPDDLQFGTQWHLLNTGQSDDSMAGADIHATEAWSIFTGDPDFTVAVIDTGVDFFHPDLEANMWLNQGEIIGNGRDDDGNGFVDDIYGYDFQSNDSDPFDDHGHGTHVAGILGAVSNNQIGIAGVAWKVRIMALKTFSERGQGNISLAVDAIQYAVQNGAKVINASWGSEERSRVLEEVIRAAREDGVMTIAAAGNDRSEQPYYPAWFDTVISVGSTDFRDAMSDFSNYGPTVDIAAPGTGIFSTKINNTYGSLNGTSMATPMVSGVAALIWGRKPYFSLQDVENIILSTADPLDVAEELGSGRLNAWRALQVDEPIPTARLIMPLEVSGRFDIRGTADGPTLQDFILEIGEGFQPVRWVEFHRSSNPVADGFLLQSYSTAGLQEGEYTIRLRARNAQGREAVAQRRIRVNNVDINTPDNNDFLAHGPVVPIIGSVFGLGRTYTLEYGPGRIPQNWYSDAITLPESDPGSLQDEVLGYWDTSRLKPGEFYSLRLVATASDGQQDIDQSWMLYLDQNLNDGWPQIIRMSDTIDSTSDWKNFKVEDLDGDGDREVIVIQPGDEDILPSRLLVFNHLGELQWSRDLSPGKPFGGSAVIGQMDEDPELEIAAHGGGDEKIHLFNHDGTPFGHSWPLVHPGQNIGKVMADVDGDGIDELITLNNEAFFIGSRPVRRLSVYKSTGALLVSWDMDDCFHAEDVPRIVPAVADMDGDGQLEFVTPSGCSGLSLYDMENKSSPVWRVTSNGQFLTSPIIGDLDGDTSLEVVASVFDPEDSNRGGVYVFTSDGIRYGSFPVLVTDSLLDAPVLADMDDDSDLEIVVNSRFRNQIHVLHHDGFNAEGWPTRPLVNEFFRGQPAVGDLNGDGILEVLAPVHGIFLLFANTGEQRYLGGIRVYDFNGEISQTGPGLERNWIPFPSAGKAIADKNHLIQLTDMDGDGFLDILLSSISDMAYVPNKPSEIRPKNAFSIYSWEQRVLYNPGSFPWPSYQGGSSQQGFFLNPPKPNRAPQFSDISAQVSAWSREWLPVDLKLLVTDPDHEFSELEFEVIAGDSLNAVIDERGVLRVTTFDPDWQGAAVVRVVATDPRGGTSRGTLRYTADSSLNFPEVSPDSVITDEDTPVSVNVLANDSDFPEGLPQLVGAGPALRGRVSITPESTVVYSPPLDFSGTDSFTYTVRGKGGGQSVGRVDVQINPVNDPPRTGVDRVILDEDTQIVIRPLLNDMDPEGDPIRIVDVASPTSGTLSENADGSYTYVPAANFFGEERLRYRVEDIHGLQSEGLIHIIVRPVNDPPIASDITISMNKNTVGSIIFKAVDLDGDELKYEVIKNASHGEVLAFPTVAEYIPDEGFLGVDTFTYIASDPFSRSTEATVTITVLDRNNPPRARGDSVFTLVDQPLKIELRAEDPDGDEFEILIDSEPEHGTLASTDEDHVYIYTANEGFVGKDRIVFHARDQESAGPSATFRIEVTDENTTPRARDQFITTRMDLPVEFELQVFDREGTELDINEIEAPQNGTIEVNGVQAVYSPNEGFLGVDRFVYEASDGVNSSRRATVFFRVRFPNDEPVVTEKKIILLRGQSLTFQLPVIDPDEDALRSAIVKGPKNGSVYGSGITYTYKPVSSFIGTDSFTFRSWDGITYGDIGVIEIEVRAFPINVQLDINDFLISDNDSYSIRVTGTNGLRVALDFSTNLSEWQEIQQADIANREALFTGRIPEEFSGSEAGFFRLRPMERAQ